MDLYCLLAVCGLLPAGILALELLQQSRSLSGANEDFLRSGIIQNLSLRSLPIDSIIRSTSGNYRISHQAKKMLQATLDMVLSFNRSSLPNQHPERGVHDRT